MGNLFSDTSTHALPARRCRCRCCRSGRRRPTCCKPPRVAPTSPPSWCTLQSHTEALCGAFTTAYLTLADSACSTHANAGRVWGRPGSLQQPVALHEPGQLHRACTHLSGPSCPCSSCRCCRTHPANRGTCRGQMHASSCHLPWLTVSLAACDTAHDILRLDEG